jgi:alpha-tubulin suppressor-like RCC1 family protein
VPIHYTPQLANFDQYYRPNIQSISAGGAHTSFVDDIGRLFVCGKGKNGQLGLGTYLDEYTPFYVTRIPDKIVEAACGEEHTIVLTLNGEIYTMGSNTRG